MTIEIPSKRTHSSNYTWLQSAIPILSKQPKDRVTPTYSPRLPTSLPAYVLSTGNTKIQVAKDAIPGKFFKRVKAIPLLFPLLFILLSQTRYTPFHAISSQASTNLPDIKHHHSHDCPGSL